MFTFSIDCHKFWPYRADSVAITPPADPVAEIRINAGERWRAGGALCRRLAHARMREHRCKYSGSCSLFPVMHLVRCSARVPAAQGAVLQAALGWRREVVGLGRQLLQGQNFAPSPCLGAEALSACGG